MCVDGPHGHRVASLSPLNEGKAPRQVTGSAWLGDAQKQEAAPSGSFREHVARAALCSGGDTAPPSPCRPAERHCQWNGPARLCQIFRQSQSHVRMLARRLLESS